MSYSLHQITSIFLLVSVSACGGSSQTSAPTTAPPPPLPPAASAPVISSFVATPSNINVGQSSQLIWQVSGASNLSLNGNVISGTSLTVAPIVDTVYTLVASNAACASTCNTAATATIHVSAIGPVGNTIYGDLRKADLGAGANLNGALAFPASNAWNTDISTASIDPASDAIIANIGLTRGLHPDFGAGLYEGAPIGIPYIVVAANQPKVAVQFTDYGDESEPGPYPIPATAPIEGQLASGAAFGGDRHVLVIDRDANRLYEVGNAYPQPDSSWKTSGGAIFDLTSNIVRPNGQPGWTSADAAGLPIFPGLVRYEEAASGVIRHALRFTVSTSRRAYVPPATHWASSNTDSSLAPMGMRVRLKASFVIPANFSNESKAILQAMKSYGMLVADNGSNWYISGAPDARWNNDKLLSELGSVKGVNFEVIKMTGIVKP